jgi:hypothetical protein
MSKPFALLVVAMAVIATGCRSTHTNNALFPAGYWQDARQAKACLDAYKHVFIACVYSDNWEDRWPDSNSPHHFKATVVRSYKGDWNLSDRVAFVHYVDGHPSGSSNAQAGNLVLIYTDQHTNAEIVLDAGEFQSYDSAIERALLSASRQDKS